MPTFLEIAKAELERERDYDYSLKVNGQILPFPSGSLIVVGGRPAMGKTTLLLHFFLLLSEKYNEKQLFLSGDLKVARLFQRIVSIVTQTSFEVLHLFDDEPIVSYPILSKENCIIESIAHHWAHAKELIASSEAKFIFLDYIQLFFPQTISNQQYDANLHLLKELKKMALKHKKVIVLASQLSCKLKRKKTKIPTITDFLPNQPLAEVADIIMMLYRPAYYGFTEDSEGNDIRNKAILTLVKSNYSPLFEMNFEVDKRTRCFNKL